MRTLDSMIFPRILFVFLACCSMVSSLVWNGWRAHLFSEIPKKLCLHDSRRFLLACTNSFIHSSREQKYKSVVMNLERDFAFAGFGRIVGTDSLELLRTKHICIVGIGGVGSWAAEALARSGIGSLTLIDMDEVCLSNTNRQVHTLRSTIGQFKVDAMADRIRMINPACNVSCVQSYITRENAHALLSAGRNVSYDFVLDAIDNVDDKAALIRHCVEQQIPVCTSGGAGGKSDPTAVRHGDIATCGTDRVLSRLRRKLRQRHGFPYGSATSNAADPPWNIPAVFSVEEISELSSSSPTCINERISEISSSSPTYVSEGGSPPTYVSEEESPPTYAGEGESKTTSVSKEESAEAGDACSSSSSFSSSLCSTSSSSRSSSSSSNSKLGSSSSSSSSLCSASSSSCSSSSSTSDGNLGSFRPCDSQYGSSCMAAGTFGFVAAWVMVKGILEEARTGKSARARLAIDYTRVRSRPLRPRFHAAAAAQEVVVQAGAAVQPADPL